MVLILSPPPENLTGSSATPPIKVGAWLATKLRFGINRHFPARGWAALQCQVVSNDRITERA